MNVVVSPDPSPSVTPPVFEKVTASVIVAPPVRDAEYPCPAVFNVVAVNAPWNAIVPVVSVSVTVEASTLDWKVTPPDCVTVTVPISVPTAPDAANVPVVFTVTFEDVPDAVPLSAATVIAPPLATPVPKVSVAPSDKVVAPLIPVVDVPLSSVVSAVTLTAASEIASFEV